VDDPDAFHEDAELNAWFYEGTTSNGLRVDIVPVVVANQQRGACRPSIALRSQPAKDAGLMWTAFSRVLISIGLAPMGSQLAATIVALANPLSRGPAIA
jgi:hypothetical protein